jgi:hypothetical protein
MITVLPDFLVVPAFLVVLAFLIVRAFRSFGLSGRSGFPVVPAFRSFWLSCLFRLSGRSGFPVILAFRSFQLPNHSDFSMVTEQKNPSKKASYCLFAKKSPIHFSVTNTNRNRYFLQKQHVQMAIKPRSPRSEATS